MKILKSSSLAILVCVTSNVLAQQNEQLDDDMELNKPPITTGQPIYSSSPKIHKQTADSKHCTEFSQKIETLKGKPQQRYAASQRYREECTTTGN